MIIMLTLLFSAQNFVPEFKGQVDESQDYIGNLQLKYSNTDFDESIKLHICPNHQDYCNLISFSTDYYINGSENSETFYKETYIPLRQFTVIFNTFVMMQLFNFINARRIRDEHDIFQGILTNILFPIIVFGILTLQIIIVTFGGIVFHCYSFYGLRIEQWLIYIIFGVGGLVVRLLLRLIPDPKLQYFNKLNEKHKLKNLISPSNTLNNQNYQIQFLSPESEIDNLNNSIQEHQI